MVAARNAYRLLTFRHLFKYKDLKLRVHNGSWLKERTTTMANDQKDKPCKDKVDKLADEAKSKLDKVKNDHPDLEAELQPVYTSIDSIRRDVHR